MPSSQMAMDGRTRWPTPMTRDEKRLDDVVLLLVPSLNPDGQIMITDYYRK